MCQKSEDGLRGFINKTITFWVLIFWSFFFLTSHVLSQGDSKKNEIQFCPSSFQALKEGRWGEAVTFATSSCPLLREAAEWLLMQGSQSGCTFEQITHFMTRHLDWPKINILKERAEEAMDEKVSDSSLIAWFQDHPPVTGRGSFFYAKALFQVGMKKQSQKFIRHTWKTQIMDPSACQKFMKEFENDLTPNDFLKRVDMLLWEENVKDVYPLLKYLPIFQQLWAHGRISLITNNAHAQKFFETIRFLFKKDSFLRAGLSYDYLKYLRKKKSLEAYKFYETISAKDRQHHLDKWWIEKDFLCRRAIYNKNYKVAYRVARDHHILEGKDMAEAEFLLGWVGLRFLKNPQRALSHFKYLYTHAKRPQTKARGAFWMGRSYEARGQKENADQWYQKAAEYQSTFYGQLASDKIRKPLKVQTLLVSPQSQKLYNAQPLAQVARLFYASNQVKKGRLILSFLQTKASSLEEALALIALTHQLDPEFKGGIINDLSKDWELLIHDAYPILPLPRKTVPASLVHAIIRQESSFNPSVISFDYGHGLMQLMDFTAKRMAKRLNMPFSERRLTEDPHYNMVLGIEHIEEILEEVAGAHILVIPSYNAGVKAVENWVEQHGDPRGLLPYPIDLIDWIELIPIKGTSGYVQRVLANRRIYDVLLSSQNSNEGT